MRATVTNWAAGARGFHVRDGGTVVVEPGASAALDLADHPAHRAWEAAGEVTIVAAGEEGQDANPPRLPSPVGREKVARRSRVG